MLPTRHLEDYSNMIWMHLSLVSAAFGAARCTEHRRRELFEGKVFGRDQRDPTSVTASTCPHGACANADGGRHGDGSCSR